MEIRRRYRVMDKTEYTFTRRNKMRNEKQLGQTKVAQQISSQTKKDDVDPTQLDV